MLTLYSYFRSSATYRVRIALNLKGLAYEIKPVHLLGNGGEQYSAKFDRLNPSHLVPVLKDGSVTLTQSLAIIEYLDEKHPAPPLLPSHAAARAKVRGVAFGLACEVHPLNNLRVMQYLKTTLGSSDAERALWSRHWMELGFNVVERLLSEQATPSRFVWGDAPTLADCCLVPQIFNALRVKVPLERYPCVMRVYENCIGLPAFQRAAPHVQVDAE